FKSISNLKMPLGRVNVLIGENGSGKSNILEAIAMASAAAADKLDHEFLASRGIRVTAPDFMRSAFNAKKNLEIKINLEIDGKVIIECTLETKKEKTYTRLINTKPSFASIVYNLVKEEISKNIKLSPDDPIWPEIIKNLPDSLEFDKINKKFLKNNSASTSFLN